jgi:DNA-directed RNA polymerase specialized sigma54-like protein
MCRSILHEENGPAVKDQPPASQEKYEPLAPLILGPRMMLSLEVLQLPIMDLQKRIEHELVENPVLELRDPCTDDQAPSEELGEFRDHMPDIFLERTDDGDYKVQLDMSGTPPDHPSPVEEVNEFQDHRPDIFLKRSQNGEYTVHVVEDWNIYISKRYIELYEDPDSKPVVRKYLKRKIKQAQWLLESIEQRRNTLEKITRAIIKHQREFFNRIEPLKMRQIAHEAGLHVTTMSRAVEGKWLQTPHGLFPLESFFGGSLNLNDG